MAELMRGKRGLVMGVANDHSIAWGIAKALSAEGAELAFSYQGEAFERRVRPLAESLGSTLLLDMDVTDDASLDAGFRALRDSWGGIDFLIHAIAWSDKNELSGRFINTTRENFKTSLDISCYSLIDLCRRAAPLMPQGGSVVTLTFQGSRAGHALLQRDGGGQGRAGGGGALSGQRSGAGRDPGERDLAGADADAGRRRHRCGAQDLQGHRAECAAARQSDAGRCRRHRGLAVLGLCGGDHAARSSMSMAAIMSWACCSRKTSAEPARRRKAFLKQIAVSRCCRCLSVAEPGHLRRG